MKIREDRGEYRLTAWMWLLTCLLLLVLVFFFPHVKYASKVVFANPFLLAFLGLTFFGLLYLLVKGRTIRKGSTLIMGLFFLGLQIWCVKNYYFVPGWDSSDLLYVGALAPLGESDEYLVDYFSYYPNNMLLAVLYIWVFSFVYKCGGSWTAALEVILYLQCLISFAAGQVTFKVIEKITKDRSTAFWGYLAYLALIGLSPWVAIPYSDSATLVFPILILWLYLAEPGRPVFKYLKWAAIGSLGIFGYGIKPTVMITVIAVVCIELHDLFKTRDYKAAAGNAALFMLGIFCTAFLIGQIVDSFPYETDPEKRVGLAHFFAMGLNDEQMGIWSEKDVAYSISFDTVKERDAAEWALAKERIADMKVSGLLRQGIRKLLTSFHNGTFAWAHGGKVFFVDFFDNDSLTAKITRSFYYNTGEHYRLFLNTEQAVWLSMLLLSLGAFLAKGRGTAVAELTLLGLVLYLLLFETRARYVYIFAPLFIVLAACGADHILSFRIRGRRKPSGNLRYTEGGTQYGL